MLQVRRAKGLRSGENKDENNRAIKRRTRSRAREKRRGTSKPEKDRCLRREPDEKAGYKARERERETEGEKGESGVWIT